MTLDSWWIQRFSPLSLNSWLARELGGGWRKLRIEISMPLKFNLPGFCVGHLLKCLATVVSVLGLCVVMSFFLLCVFIVAAIIEN